MKTLTQSFLIFVYFFVFSCTIFLEFHSVPRTKFLQASVCPDWSNIGALIFRPSHSQYLQICSLHFSFEFFVYNCLKGYFLDRWGFEARFSLRPRLRRLWWPRLPSRLTESTLYPYFSSSDAGLSILKVGIKFKCIMIRITHFWPRAILKGPERSFVVVVVVLLLGVESSSKKVINITKNVREPNLLQSEQEMLQRVQKMFANKICFKSNKKCYKRNKKYSWRKIASNWIENREKRIEKLRWVWPCVT